MTDIGKERHMCVCDFILYIQCLVLFSKDWSVCWIYCLVLDVFPISLHSISKYQPVSSNIG